MEVLTDVSLKKILFYKIGGTAKTVLKIKNKQDLEEAIEYLKEHKPARVLPVGLGANLLISDKSFDGVILWFAEPEDNGIKIHEDGLVEVFASVSLDDVIKFSLEHSLMGLEWAGGLPSSAGAAVRGNVGCFGNEIKRIVKKVDVVDLNHFELTTLTNEQLKFSYRNSLIKQHKNLLISTVYFRLKKATREELSDAKQIYQDNIEYRKRKHPIEYPSCGSVFKNITDQTEVESIMQGWPDIAEKVLNAWHGKVSMGYVIKRLGLSDYRVGGAQVSEKHCNYISNIDNAKFDDVYTIIKLIQQKVFEQFGFYPEPEVEIIS